MKTSLTLSALTVVALAGASDKPKEIRLPQTQGSHSMQVQVGDVLVFDTTYRQSASTGYVWRGPKVSGDVFGKTQPVFVKVAGYEKLKKEAAKKPPMPGAPEPALGQSFVKIPVTKVGKGQVVFVFSRLAIDAKRQIGDKICTFEVTVLPKK